MARSRILLSIQYLRALAALAVVASHTGWMRSDIGQVGVDLFFVISGFIMMHVSQREASPLTFLRARTLRIIPLYWLITLPMGWIRGDSVAHVGMSLAFWPHIGPEGLISPVIIAGWTLCYEVFFYLIFAVLVMLPVNCRLLTLTAVFVALCLAGFILHPAQAAMASFTSPLLLEFVMGAWLWQAWQRGWLARGYAGIALLTLGGIMLAVQVIISAPHTWRFVLWGVPASLVAAGALGIEAAGRLPAMPWLRRLGGSSYSLYLSHAATLSLVFSAVHPLPVVLALVSALLMCVIIGLLVYRFVEHPIQRVVTLALSPDHGHHGAAWPSRCTSL